MADANIPTPEKDEIVEIEDPDKKADVDGMKPMPFDESNQPKQKG
jgi:hypothetical protein